MLTVVCWKWKPIAGYRSEFGPETVNVLRRMVARHYRSDFRFLCVTDDASGIDPEIEVRRLWNDFAHVPPPQGRKNPSCYRRLRAFAPDIASIFGERFVSIDLDTVIVGDLAPIFDRPEPFVIWGDTNPTTYYNGGLFLMTAGARPQVWEQFDPETSPMRAKAAGHFGSDQGWISYCLGPGEAKFSKTDGVYSFRNDIASPRGPRPLPEGARLISFHGNHDPWSMRVQAEYPWVRASWQ